MLILLHLAKIAYILAFLSAIGLNDAHEFHHTNTSLLRTLYNLISEIIYLLGTYPVLEIATTKSHMKL